MLFRFNYRRRPAKKRKAPAKMYLDHKEQARVLIHSRLDYFNRFYGYTWHRVSVKDTKRRWGSCSKKGNLNFSYKVAFLPPELADYVIVHELCHLGQFNHSAAFWQLVERTISDFKSLRKKLSTFSEML